MPAHSKGNTRKTTLLTTDHRLKLLDELVEQRNAKFVGAKGPSQRVTRNDVLNEAIDHFAEYNNDVRGSQAALAFGVEEKIQESLAILSTQYLALTRLLLEMGKVPLDQVTVKILATYEWAAANYPYFATQVAEKRKERIRKSRADHAAKVANTQFEIQKSRIEKAHDEAQEKFLNSAPPDEQK